MNSLIWSWISDITQKTGVLLSHLNSPGNRIASDCRTSPKNWTFFTAAATKLPYTQSLTTTPKPATWFSALFATSTFIFEKPVGGRHQLGWLVSFLFSKWFELGILNLQAKSTWSFNQYLEVESRFDCSEALHLSTSTSVSLILNINERIEHWFCPCYCSLRIFFSFLRMRFIPSTRNLAIHSSNGNSDFESETIASWMTFQKSDTYSLYAKSPSMPELHSRILPYPPFPMQFPVSKLFLALIISPCIIFRSNVDIERNSRWFTQLLCCFCDCESFVPKEWRN